MANGIDILLRFATLGNAQAAGAISGLTATFTALSAAIAAVGTAAAKTAIEFDKSLRDIASITDTSASQLVRLGKAIREISVMDDISDSANNLAQAVNELAGSGFEKLADSIKIATVASKAATAGNVETMTSARALAGVLNSYSLTANDAAAVSDKLFTIVRDGSVTFSALSNNLSGLLPIASSVGISINEVGASIIEMSKTSMPMAQIETALAGLYRQLAAATPEAKKAAEALGVDIGEKALQKGLIPVLQDLQKATGGSLELIRKIIPDTEGANAALILMKNNAAGLSKSMDSMNNSSLDAGNTQKALEEQTKSYSFQINKLSNEINDLKLEYGKLIAEAFVPLIVKVREAIKDFDYLDDVIADNVKSVIEITTEIKNFRNDVIDTIPGLRTFLNILDSLKSFLNTFTGDINLFIEGFKALRDTINADIANAKLKEQKNNAADLIKEYQKLTASQKEALSPNDLNMYAKAFAEYSTFAEKALEGSGKVYRQKAQDLQKEGVLIDDLTKKEKAAQDARNLAAKNAGIARAKDLSINNDKAKKKLEEAQREAFQLQRELSNENINLLKGEFEAKKVILSQELSDKEKQIKENIALSKAEKSALLSIAKNNYESKLSTLKYDTEVKTAKDVLSVRERNLAEIAAKEKLTDDKILNNRIWSNGQYIESLEQILKRTDINAEQRKAIEEEIQTVRINILNDHSKRVDIALQEEANRVKTEKQLIDEIYQYVNEKEEEADKKRKDAISKQLNDIGALTGAVRDLAFVFQKLGGVIGDTMSTATNQISDVMTGISRVGAAFMNGDIAGGISAGVSFNLSFFQGLWDNITYWDRYTADLNKNAMDLWKQMTDEYKKQTVEREKLKADEIKKRYEAEKKYLEDIKKLEENRDDTKRKLVEKAYDLEVKNAEKAYELQKELFDKKIADQQKVVDKLQSDLDKITEKLDARRKKRSESYNTSSAFNNDLERVRSGLDEGFFRQSSESFGVQQAADELFLQGQYNTGKISFDQFRKESMDLAVKETIYLENLKKTTKDPKEKNELQKQLNSLFNDYADMQQEQTDKELKDQQDKLETQVDNANQVLQTEKDNLDNLKLKYDEHIAYLNNKYKEPSGAFRTSFTIAIEAVNSMILTSSQNLDAALLKSATDLRAKLTAIKSEINQADISAKGETALLQKNLSAESKSNILSGPLDALSIAFKAIGIPAFAGGGFVQSPTLAMVGEAGPEWILNRSQMSNLLSSGANSISLSFGDISINNGMDLDKFTSMVESSVYKAVKRKI